MCRRSPISKRTYPLLPYTTRFRSSGSKSRCSYGSTTVMAIFFLLVGLEIKRELVEGELSTREQAVLPFLAALGGMVVPGLVYSGVNRSEEHTSELQSLMRLSSAVFCLQKKYIYKFTHNTHHY